MMPFANRSPNETRRIAIPAALVVSYLLGTVSASAQSAASPGGPAPPAVPSPTSAANPDWPCVQHKQNVLTAAQMWDGPAIEPEGKRSDDAEIRKLVKIVVSRRLEMPAVEAEIKAYAEKQPEAARDAKLTELFAAVLAEINAQRNTLIEGIERFQRQQVARAKKLEEEGIALADLQHKAEKDPALTDKLADAQQRYDWDARVFQERQQNVPIACEIPVLVESRAFEASQAIRALMKN